jgi:homoserine O-acetyltransferase
VDGTIPLVSRGRSPSQHMMRHFVQRQTIMNDPNWQNGDYYGTGRYPSKGMATASVLSSVSYTNSVYWYENNMEEADPTNSAYADFNNKFKIEKELWERSLAGAEAGLDANCWLYRSWAVTRQNIGWKRGDYSRGWRANLADALQLVKADVLMMPSRTDDSMRPEWAKEIVDILRSMGKKARLHVIDTERGHGGATDYYQTNPIMTEFINQLPSAKRTPKSTSGR